MEETDVDSEARQFLGWFEIWILEPATVPTATFRVWVVLQAIRFLQPRKQSGHRLNRISMIIRIRCAFALETTEHSNLKDWDHSTQQQAKSKGPAWFHFRRENVRSELSTRLTGCVVFSRR